MTSVSIRETIDALGTTEIANEMGLSISTLHYWKMSDAIPGRGPMREARVKIFQAAVKAVERRKKKAAKPSAAA